ncbi:MAG: hypothetical protein IJP13_07235 [Lachnospiraceae bacterium]|nr:hypothetical protein [Lachnospiraceae bacterium]
MKKNFLTFIFLFLFFLMLSFPDITKNSANIGMELWLSTILPALLPYTVISSLLLYLDAFNLPCKFFEKILKRPLPKNHILIVLCGLFCGCPIGAKLAADSYKNGLIKKSTATFLMCACNNLSPSFLINFVFARVYTPFIHINSTDKWILYIIMIFSSFFCSYFVTKPLYKNSDNICDNNNICTEKDNKTPFFTFFEKCILSAFEIQAKIGGYIIIFSIISGLFLYTMGISNITGAIIGSFLESSSGLNLFASYSETTNHLNIPYITGIITALTSFGGICTIFQTKSVLHGSSLPISFYIKSKLLSSVFVFLLSFIYMSI